jgi:hypothetical protein
MKDVLKKFWELASIDESHPLMYSDSLNPLIWEHFGLEAKLPTKVSLPPLSLPVSNGGDPVQLGAYRYEAVEELFSSDDELSRDRCTGLIHTIIRSIEAIDASLRLNVLENCVITGGGSRVRNLKERIEFGMTSSYLAIGANIGELQPRDIKFKEIPEYLESYKNKFELTGYLGASLLSKVRSLLTFNNNFKLLICFSLKLVYR